MIDGIMQGKHMKRIFEIEGIFSITVYFCTFLTFFKMFRIKLKDALHKKNFNDFIVISIKASFPDIHYDCLLTKKPIFSVYLSLLKSSYKLYKKFKYVIIDYVLTHQKDIYMRSCHNKSETRLLDGDFDGDAVTRILSLYIYIDDITFYNLYET